MLLTSCTVVPKQPIANVPSFSGNDQTSGVVGVTNDHYIIITQSKLDEYDWVVVLYGQKMIPPLHKGDGILIRDGLILIDKEHFVKFAQMKDMIRKEIR